MRDFHLGFARDLNAREERQQAGSGTLLIGKTGVQLDILCANQSILALWLDISKC